MARRKKCKNGYLKSFLKTGKGRRCRKCSRIKRCRWGKLAHPVKGRICKKKPGGGR